MESTQVWDQEQTKPQKQLLKAKSSKIYSGKSYMDCYHFCQQYEDYFKISGVTKMNCTPFIALFLCGTISFR